MKRLFSLLTAVALFSCAGLFAGDFGGDAALYEEEPDAGMEAVYEAQMSPAGEYVKFVSALDQIQEYAEENGYDKTWDEERNRWFIVQYATFNVEDPATDGDFLIRREIAAKEVVLRAKSDIIRAIMANMSGKDQIGIPGTPPHRELNAKHAALQERIREQQQRLVALLERVDAAEARALNGVTIGDRLLALLDGVIRRIDSEFSAGNIEAAHRERFEATKLQYAEAMADLEKLWEQADAIKETHSSAVAVHAVMPLTGATVIRQAESWDEESGTYEMAMLFCWSAELENAARATLSGSAAPDGGRIGQESLKEWLDRQDLGAMIGPRQFLDDQGQRHFIGITSRPVVRNSSIDRRNRTAADMFASQMAIFSLFADVDSYTNAEQMAQVRSSSDANSAAETDIEESIAENLTQSFQNMNVQGLMPVVRKRVRHAITGQNMHVSVYGITPASAAAAMLNQRRAALSAMAVNQGQTFRAARNQALSDAVRASAGDAASRRAGELAGWEEAGVPRPQAAPAPAVTAPQTPAPARRSPSRSVMSGDVRDDF